MRNGVVFSYRGSWCAEGLRTSWESAWRIVGTRGALTWDGEEDMRAEIATGPDALFQKTEPVPRPHVEIDAVHHGLLAVPLGQAAGSNHRVARDRSVANFSSAGLVSVLTTR